jgi:hypothetical protein
MENYLTGTATTFHGSPITLSDILAVGEKIKALPPEPIGEWMKSRGYSPEEWILCAPESFFSDIEKPLVLPSYVRISSLLTKALFVGKHSGATIHETIY